MRLQLEGDEDVGIALAPLIDIVFLLLIFFLVGSVMEKSNREMAIAIPHMASAIMRSPSESSRIITIDRQGQFFVDGELVNRSELSALLDLLSFHQNGIRLRLDVDQRASIKYLAELLEMLRQRHITNFGLHAAGSLEK